MKISNEERPASWRNRGRDAGGPAPPAQIPAGGFPAPGSSPPLASRTARRIVVAEQVHSPYLASTPIGLAPQFNAAGFLRYPRQRHAKELQQPIEASPRVPPSLTPPIQHI